jgi:DNA-directed RNA polymerase subunit RPC12/RpoP
VYVVIICYNCGKFLLAKNSQKTKKCNYCSAKLALIKARKVIFIKNPQEASKYIRSLKLEKMHEYTKET